MTTAQVGRSREELLAAAAALTAAVHDVDDLAAAAVLTERAKQFEEESMDAAPITAAGEVTDDQIIDIIDLGLGAGIAVLLASASGDAVPEAVSRSVASTVRRRALANTLLRHEMVEASRRVLAGGCMCGQCGQEERP